MAVILSDDTVSLLAIDHNIPLWVRAVLLSAERCSERGVAHFDTEPHGYELSELSEMLELTPGGIAVNAAKSRLAIRQAQRRGLIVSHEGQSVVRLDTSQIRRVEL